MTSTSPSGKTSFLATWTAVDGSPAEYQSFIKPSNNTYAWGERSASCCGHQALQGQVSRPQLPPATHRTIFTAKLNTVALYKTFGSDGSLELLKIIRAFHCGKRHTNLDQRLASPPPGGTSPPHLVWPSTPGPALHTCSGPPHLLWSSTPGLGKIPATMNAVWIPSLSKTDMLLPRTGRTRHKCRHVTSFRSGIQVESRFSSQAACEQLRSMGERKHFQDK